MEYTRSELIRRLSDIPRKGWTDHQIRDLIDSLWRDPFFNRTSGFDTPGDFDSDIAFDNETRTFSITPKAYSFNFWQFIRKIAFFKRTEPMEVIIPDEEGFYLIYIARDEEDPKKPQKLFALKNPTYEQEQDVYLLKTIVSWIYWDAANSQAIYFGEERHGSEWPPQLNWWAHSGFNLILKEGLTLDLGNSLGEQFFSIFNDANFFGVAPGKALHEDIEIDYSGILSSNMPLQWFTGTLSDPKPRIYVGDIAPKMSGFWNYYSHQQEEWSMQNLEAPFTLVHIYATNCKQYPILAQFGSEEYEDKHRAIQGFYRERQHIEVCMPQKSKLFLFTAICWHSPEGLVFINASDVSAVMTDANYSQIVAKAEVMDALPRLKTGWPPNPFNYVRVIGLGGDVKIQATAGRFPIFLLGEKQYFGEVSVYIDPLHHGMQYFSMNRSGESRSFEKWDNASNSLVFIMAAFQNKTKAKTLYYGLELHNWEMDPTARGFMHDTLFTEYVDGLAISIANNGIVVQPGRIKDEDFIYPIGLKSALQCPKYFLYVDGTEGLTWDSYDNLTIPVILDQNNHISFHDPANPGQMLSTETGDWTCMWVLATMCGQYPIKLIPGTGKGKTKEEAEEKNPVTELKQLIDATDFFCEEYIVLGRVPVQDTGETPFFTLTGVTDFKDIDLEKLGKDIYVEDGEFDEVSSELVLHRTQKMPEIRIPIPQPEIPEIPEQVNSDWNATEGKAEILNKPSSLPPSAHTHVHNDTTNKQGGNPLNNEFYHLEKYQFQNLSGVIELSSPTSLMGFIYNYHAALDSRNISSEGWHVPSFSEWQTVVDFLGGASVAGGKMKETGTGSFNSPNTGATNSSGFNGKGCGARDGYAGVFFGLKETGHFLSSTLYGQDNTLLGPLLRYNSESLSLSSSSPQYKTNGSSIRLLKDSTSLSNGQTGTYIGNDGKKYNTICIGNQEWLSENLIETKYRNGDTIPVVQENAAWAALSTGARCSYNNDDNNSFEKPELTKQADWNQNASTEIDYIKNKPVLLQDTVVAQKIVSEQLNGSVNGANRQFQTSFDIASIIGVFVNGINERCYQKISDRAILFDSAPKNNGFEDFLFISYIKI